MPAQPFVATPPLRFRGISDSLATSHLEASECCLIHADNPLIAENKRTYVNPQVRVGYSGEAYDKVHGHGSILSSSQIFRALWENRLRRWVTTPRLKEWTVGRSIDKWRTESEEHKEVGEHCIVNEMQVVIENGWAHV